MGVETPEGVICPEIQTVTASSISTGNKTGITMNDTRSVGYYYYLVGSS